MIEFRRCTYDGGLRSNIEDVVEELQQIVMAQQMEINDLKAKLATTAEEANRAARAVTLRKYHASPGSAYKPSKALIQASKSQFDDTNLPGMYELLYRS